MLGMSNFTADDLANIDRAISSGELEVQYRDRRVTYRSVDELKKARALILGELQSAGLISSCSSSRTTLAYRVRA